MNALESENLSPEMPDKDFRNKIILAMDGFIAYRQAQERDPEIEELPEPTILPENPGFSGVRFVIPDHDEKVHREFSATLGPRGINFKGAVSMRDVTQHGRAVQKRWSMDPVTISFRVLKNPLHLMMSLAGVYNLVRSHPSDELPIIEFPNRE
jgi:hypothetical protein